ncbi:hypothetical protein C8F01DRAFT_781041 [Mycena amicta]|nr:hypothetical protein C8F01DRAFT_781041 [Mycena amicta]
MHFFVVTCLLLLARPLRVAACEGNCIDQTTAAFQKHEDVPVHSVMNQIVRILEDSPNVLNDSQGTDIISAFDLNTGVTPQSLMKPAMAAYQNVAFTNLRQDIFPGLFHGKCQNKTTNIDPPGCPKPDCAVICGTPGSMVHFYDLLCAAVHNSTLKSISESFDQHSDSFQAILVAVLGLVNNQGAAERRDLRFRRFAAVAPSKSEVISVLRSKMNQSGEMLERACGGPGRPSCRWEKDMKPFILSFP